MHKLRGVPKRCCCKCKRSSRRKRLHHRRPRSLNGATVAAQLRNGTPRSTLSTPPRALRQPPPPPPQHSPQSLRSSHRQHRLRQSRKLPPWQTFLCPPVATWMLQIVCSRRFRTVRSSHIRRRRHGGETYGLEFHRRHPATPAATALSRRQYTKPSPRARGSDRVPYGGRSRHHRPCAAPGWLRRCVARAAAAPDSGVAVATTSPCRRSLHSQ